MTAYLENSIRGPATDEVAAVTKSTANQTSCDDNSVLLKDHDELVKSLHTTKGYL